MDAILWPSTKFPVQIQLQKFYSTFGPREVYNDYNGMGEWIYDQYNGSIGLVAGRIGMPLYNWIGSWLDWDDTLQLPGHLAVLRP